MKTLLHMTLEEIYLDWVNNFISIEGMADYYDVKVEVLQELITITSSTRKEVYG